jgi:hypothetical protein
MGNTVNNITYNALVESGLIRYYTLPIGAGVAVVSDGAAAAWAYPAANLHVQIQAAALLPAAPSWFCGVAILANNLEVGCYADLAIGFGPDGAGIDVAEFPYYNELAAAAGVVAMTPVMYLPYPVKIATNLRVAGRIRKSSAASGVGITVKIIVATAVGT